MDRLTEKAWRNFDPWECCGQDSFCQRGCHDEGGCANGCIVPRLYSRLAAYEDTGLTPEEATASQSQLRHWEELEGSTCPEDVGFAEYVKTLQSRLQQEREKWQQAEADNAELAEAINSYLNIMIGPFGPHLLETAERTRAIANSPHPGTALLERLQQTEKALELACDELFDEMEYRGECPKTRYGIEKTECKNNSLFCEKKHGDCWRNHFLQQAETGGVYEPK